MPSYNDSFAHFKVFTSGKVPSDHEASGIEDNQHLFRLKFVDTNQKQLNSFFNPKSQDILFAKPISGKSLKTAPRVFCVTPTETVDAKSQCYSVLGSFKVDNFVKLVNDMEAMQYNMTIPVNIKHIFNTY